MGGGCHFSQTIACNEVTNLSETLHFKLAHVLHFKAVLWPAYPRKLSEFEQKSQKFLGCEDTCAKTVVKDKNTLKGNNSRQIREKK